MSFRTPLAKVRGLGGSHHGAEHWHTMHFTSVALTFLFFWFAYSMMKLSDGGISYQEAHDWISNSWCTPLLAVFFVGLVFYHGCLGISSVMHDYIHTKSKKYLMITTLELICWLAGGTGILAILSIYFKG